MIAADGSWGADETPTVSGKMKETSFLCYAMVTEYPLLRLRISVLRAVVLFDAIVWK